MTEKKSWCAHPWICHAIYACILPATHLSFWKLFPWIWTFQVETRVRKCLSATKSRLKHLKERREKLNEQAKENEDWLQRTEQEMKLIDPSVDDSFNARSFLNVFETSCANELLAKELKQECKYYKKCLQNYESQRKREKRYATKIQWSFYFHEISTLEGQMLK